MTLPDPTPPLTRHLQIRGRVQGVGYRWSMVEQARRLGIDGWVRNRRDGSVEALVHGTPQAVEHIVGWARSGPPGARVDAVDAADSGEAVVPGSGFAQRPTA